MIKLKNQAPRPGRPLDQSPCRPMCNKCGQYMENHSEKLCQSVMLHPQNLQMKCTICRKSKGRGFTSAVATKFTKDTIMQGEDIQIPVSLHHPYDSNKQIIVPIVGYEGRSVKAVRDIQRLGHLDL